tara:strand:+ start:512 stop:691 length:180 start_codon:yes stop_codon:yes gene_type:complete
MKIQLLKSIQIAGNHCEMFDVVDVDGATADELLASKRAIAYTEKEKPKRIKKPKNVNSK